MSFAPRFFSRANDNGTLSLTRWLRNIRLPALRRLRVEKHPPHSLVLIEDLIAVVAMHSTIRDLELRLAPLGMSRSGQTTDPGLFSIWILRPMEISNLSGSAGLLAYSEIRIFLRSSKISIDDACHLVISERFYFYLNISIDENDSLSFLNWKAKWLSHMSSTRCYKCEYFDFVT